MILRRNLGIQSLGYKKPAEIWIWIGQFRCVRRSIWWNGCVEQLFFDGIWGRGWNRGRREVRSISSNDRQSRRGRKWGRKEVRGIGSDDRQSRRGRNEYVLFVFIRVWRFAVIGTKSGVLLFRLIPQRSIYENFTYFDDPVVYKSCRLELNIWAHLDHLELFVCLNVRQLNRVGIG